MTRTACDAGQGLDQLQLFTASKDVVLPRHLSKSKYVAGTQCHKLLWWIVHEPDALELQPNKVLQDRFDQGAQVEERARGLFKEDEPSSERRSSPIMSAAMSISSSAMVTAGG